MSYVGNVKKGGTTHLVGSTLYGTCSTAAGTAAKDVTCANFDALLSGVTVHVLMSNANTASSPTLNVNGTGAKSVRFLTNNARAFWVAGEVVSFTYNGTYWLMNDKATVVRHYEFTGVTGNLATGGTPTVIGNTLTMVGTGFVTGYITVAFNANATGIRQARWLKYSTEGAVEGSTTGIRVSAASSGATSIVVPITAMAGEGQYFKIEAAQTSGASLGYTASMLLKQFVQARQVQVS